MGLDLTAPDAAPAGPDPQAAAPTPPVHAPAPLPMPPPFLGTTPGGGVVTERRAYPVDPLPRVLAMPPPRRDATREALAVLLEQVAVLLRAS